jgi:hypothetical protein
MRLCCRKRRSPHRGAVPFKKIKIPSRIRGIFFAALLRKREMELLTIQKFEKRLVHAEAGPFLSFPILGRKCLRATF